MDLSAAVPYWISAGSVALTAGAQAISLYVLGLKLRTSYDGLANDSFRADHCEQDPSIEKVTARQVVPDDLSPDLLLQRITQAFDGAQSLAAGLSLLVGFIAIASVKGHANLGEIELAAVCCAVLAVGWLAAALTLPFTWYMQIFHPRKLGPIRWPTGFSLGSIALALAFIVLGIRAI